MKEIYVITGSAGEYEDRHEWMVGYFLDKEEAEKTAKFLQKAIDFINDDIPEPYDKKEKYVKEVFRGVDEGILEEDSYNYLSVQYTVVTTGFKENIWKEIREKYLFLVNSKL